MTLAERRARLFAEMMGATKIEHWDSDNYEACRRVDWVWGEV